MGQFRDMDAENGLSGVDDSHLAFSVPEGENEPILKHRNRKSDKKHEQNHLIQFYAKFREYILNKSSNNKV